MLRFRIGATANTRTLNARVVAELGTASLAWVDLTPQAILIHPRWRVWEAGSCPEVVFVLDRTSYE